MTKLHVEFVNGVVVVMLKACTVHRDAQMIMEDMKRTISELEQESSLPAVGVELVDNELATLYMNSKKSEVNAIDAAHRYHQWFHRSNELQQVNELAERGCGHIFSHCCSFFPRTLCFSLRVG